MRFYFFLLSFGISFSALAQSADTVLCTKKPTTNVSVTIKNLGFKGKIYISKDAIRKGFKLILSDSSYRVLGFRVCYFGKYGDPYLKNIMGATANEINLPILKQIIADDKIVITCVTIGRNKGLFTATDLFIFVKP